MKFNKISLAVLLAFAGLFASCSDEGYWDKATPSATALYSFSSSSISYSYTPADELPTTVEVIVHRGTTSGAVTLPVTATFSSDVLSGPESVSFADGSSTAVYSIAVDTAEVDLGESFTASLSLDSAAVSVSGKQTCTLTYGYDYTWTSAGTAAFVSGLFGNDPVEVVVEQATEATRLYRLVDPYYTISKKYAPSKGYYIQFTLDSSNNASAVSPTEQASGLVVGSSLYLLCDAAAGGAYSFTNDGNVFTIKGYFATYASGTYTPKYKANEEFTWISGYPGDE